MAITTIQDVRDEGVTVEIASDDLITAHIDTWEAAFSDQCEQWFEERSGTLFVDGDNTPSTFLQIPIITIDSITDVVNSTVLSVSDYAVYNGRTMLQDDRRNPRIILNTGLFYSGNRRWQIVGTFGYTEADGRAPAQVRRAMLMLIIEKLLNPIVETVGIPPAVVVSRPEGQTTFERTDDHEIRFANLEKQRSNYTNSGLTSNRFILETISKFRAPMGIRAPMEFVQSKSQDFFA